MNKSNVLFTLGLLVLSAEFNVVQAEYYAGVGSYSYIFTPEGAGSGGRLYESSTPGTALISHIFDLERNGATSTVVATAEVSSTPTPFVKTSLVSSGNPAQTGTNEDISATIYYDFTITGTPNSTIPLNVNSLFSSDRSDTWLTVSTNNTALEFRGYCAQYLNICGYNYNPGFTYQANPASVLLNGINIEPTGNDSCEFAQNNSLRALLLVDLDNSGKAVGNVSMFSRSIGSDAYGYLDPYFYISPEYLALNPNAAISFDVGVGNANPLVSSVPEPETYAMFLAGLGLISFSARRKA